MLGRLFGRRRAPDAGAPQLLAEAYAHHQAGRLDEAHAGYQAVLAVDRGNFDAEHLLGVIALARARPEEARAHFERAVELSPQSGAAHSNLAEAYRSLGRMEEALARLHQATRLDPQLVEAQFNLGGVLRRLGRNDEAIEAYRRALALSPDFAEAHASLGAALRETGNLDEALACSQRALALKPDSAALHLSVGNVLREKGFLDEAAAAYRAALERDPRLVEAYNNLGNVLRHQGRADEALACYERALTVKPDFAEALLNGAQVMREQRRLADAVTAYRLLISMRPDLAEAHLDLGNALKGMGDNEGALACYAKALELDPEYAEARWAIAMSQLPMVAAADAELAASRDAFSRELVALERWCRERGAWRTARAVGTQQPFYLAYQEADNRESIARYGALCAELMGAWQEAAGLPQPAPITRAETRVGIVSGHFCDHSVWHAIIKGWLQHLDRSRYDLRLFHLGTTNDIETAFAKTHATHYAFGKSDFADWARVILSHQLDVLIYPEIGIDPTTAKLASLRLARVQATSWGHPHTSGLPTIDYYLSAEALEAPDAEAHYSEKLVRLPGFGSPYAPAAVTPAAIDLGALGLRPDTPLLLCPGTPFKYTPRHDAVFVEIARRLEKCQFVFFIPQPPELMQRLRDRLTRAFAGAGLDLAACARFLPWQSRAAFHGLMQEADVYLDTIGFSGYNTAMQAVENALPIVAYEGRFLRGRLTSGILRRMGLDELVAGAEADYVQTVVRLAQDAAYWGEVRERMSAARAQLYGDAEPVRALERFLEDVVRK
jgi:protein O-GlcNAc transferase